MVIIRTWETTCVGNPFNTADRTSNASDKDDDEPSPPV